MEKKCMRPAANCPRGLSSCSQVKGLDPDGDKCRVWFENLSDGTKSAVAESYCLKFDTDDCNCVNRIYNEDYKILKAGNPIADKCWYLPCSNPDHYFVTKDDREGACPDKVCEIVYDIYKNRDVNVLKNNVVCNLEPSGGFFVKLLDLFESHGYILVVVAALVALFYVNTKKY